MRALLSVIRDRLLVAFGQPAKLLEAKAARTGCLVDVMAPRELRGRERPGELLAVARPAAFLKAWTFPAQDETPKNGRSFLKTPIRHENHLRKDCPLPWGAAAEL